MKNQKFIIDGRLDGLNELIDANRRSKYVGADLKKTNDNMVIIYARKAKLKPVVNYPIRLEITFYDDSRRDWDNIASCTKFIQDGLVAAGILKNDSKKYVKLPIYHEGLEKGNSRIEVEIKECE